MKKIIIASMCFICIMLGHVTVFAEENETNYNKLVEYICEVTNFDRESIENDIELVSQKLKCSKLESAQYIYDQVYIPSDQNNSTVTYGSGSTGSTKKVLPASAICNAVYQKSVSLGWNHGHVLMFTSASKIIEAPGIGKVVKEHSRTDNKVVIGDDYHLTFTSKASSTAKSKIVARARKDIGKFYLSSTYNTRCDIDSVNCSSLLWCAYKSQGYNIDSNGGTFVSPADIKNSKYFSAKAY